ncbi:MAG: VOC family protein [Gammaproteobacteria bacterium]|nr:MAG: VOC family protein [Gammaproteobacteria bacterium]
MSAAPAPFRVLGLDHLVVRVRNLQRALDFYCGVLGLAREREQAEIGLFQVRAGRSLIDLVPVDSKLGRMGGGAPRQDGRNIDHFALEIAPYDEPALRAHLAEHGVRIGESGSRYGAQGEGPSLYVFDPDGNMVELKGPPTF